MAQISRVVTWLAAGALVVAGLAAAQAVPDVGYTTRATAALAENYARKFGNKVPARLAGWSRYAAEQKTAGYSNKLDAAAGRESRALQEVNDRINGMFTGIMDQEHWGAVDYWATPAESIASAGGDCEDYSLAKYYLLKELGVPMARLRITYVRITRTGEAHMVLSYYATPEAEPLILDNVVGKVSQASDRFDLEPVYHFNDDEVQLIKTRQRGKPAQIRAWMALQERLVGETRI